MSFGPGKAVAVTPCGAARSRSHLVPPALLVAVFGSALVHASFLAVQLAPGSRATRPAEPPVIQARLSLPETAPPAVLPQPMAYVWKPLAAMPLAMTRMPTPPMLAHLATPAPLPADDYRGDNLVAAQPLVALTRLGEDLLARYVTEFPIEVQFPVRVHGEIKARYPEVALAQRMQGDVIVWIVVDPDGNVQEIEFAEGDEVFRDAVADAIRKSQFQPAAERGVGVRFPIALEFRFALADAGMNDGGATP